MKQTKTLIILIIILALAVGGFLIASAIAGSMENDDTAKEDETTAAVYSADSDGITSLSYVCDGETLSFTKAADKWTWDKNPDVPLSAAAIGSILSSLSDVTSSRVIENADSAKLESFGLDQPSNTVSVTDNGESTEIHFGTKNTALNSYYAYINSDTSRVYLIASDIAEAFDAPITDLIEDDTLVKISAGNAISVKVENGDTTRIFRYFADGDATDYTKIFNWYMSENGGEYFPVEETAATNLTTELAGMSLANFQSYETSVKAEKGLDNPIVVTFTYLDSDGKEQTQVLNLGTAIDENSRYACIGDSCLIYTYSGTAVLDLADKAGEALLTDRVFRPSWSYITEITVTDGTKTANIGIETVVVSDETEDTSEAEEAEAKTQINYTLNGEASDYNTAIPLFNSLAGLKASKNTVIDGIEASKEIKTVMTFEFRLEGEKCPEKFTIEIQEYTEDYYRISADGRNTLLITAEEYSGLTAMFEKIAK